jgi:hypothetical protein
MKRLTEQQKKRLVILGSDLDALWNDLAASWSNSRSVFLRTVISEIIIDAQSIAA